MSASFSNVITKSPRINEYGISPDLFPEHLSNIPKGVLLRIFNSLSAEGRTSLKNDCAISYTVQLCEYKEQNITRFKKLLEALKRETLLFQTSTTDSATLLAPLEEAKNFKHIKSAAIEIKDNIFNILKEADQEVLGLINFDGFHSLKEFYNLYQAAVAYPAEDVMNKNSVCRQLTEKLIAKGFLNSARCSAELIKVNEDHFKCLRDIFKAFLNTKRLNKISSAISVLKDLGKIYLFYSFAEETLEGGYSTIPAFKPYLSHNGFCNNFLPDIFKLCLKCKEPSKLTVAVDITHKMSRLKVEKAQQHLIRKLVKTNNIDQALQLCDPQQNSKQEFYKGLIMTLAEIRPEGWFETVLSILVDPKKCENDIAIHADFLQKMINENTLDYAKACRLLEAIKHTPPSSYRSIRHSQSMSDECVFMTVRKLMEGTDLSKEENAFSIIMSYSSEKQQSLNFLFDTILNSTHANKVEFLIKIINEMETSTRQAARKIARYCMMNLHQDAPIPYMKEVANQFPAGSKSKETFLDECMLEIIKRGDHYIELLMDMIFSLNEPAFIPALAKTVENSIRFSNRQDKFVLLDRLKIRLFQFNVLHSNPEIMS